MQQIISVRQHPEWLDIAAEYFAVKWGISAAFYKESMAACISATTLTPNWYLLVNGATIMGCCGAIDNDFMVEPTFTPWLCGLYVEPTQRGKQYGSLLLNHVRQEAGRFGVERVYLNTDHTGYYEKYGWRYIGAFSHTSGDTARIYQADAIYTPEEMGSFFDKRAESYDNHMLVDLELDAFYQAIDGCFAGLSAGTLLDIGCGTGLELERLFRRFPALAVTGIDLSPGMLEELRRKYPGQQIKTVCGSYFDVALGDCEFDYALSTYSLHHFSEEEKLGLYRRILRAIKPGGVFVLGDYTADTQEQQDRLLREKELFFRVNNPTDEFYHIDTPFTAETEMKLLRGAGFQPVALVQKWKGASIITARRTCK